MNICIMNTRTIIDDLEGNLIQHPWILHNMSGNNLQTPDIYSYQNS